MRADGGGAGETQAELAGAGGRLDVEIPPDLEVIGHEADGHEDHIGDALGPERGQMIADVRLEPGLGRGPLRLWKTSAQGCRLRSRAATSPLASSSWAT